MPRRVDRRSFTQQYHAATSLRSWKGQLSRNQREIYHAHAVDVNLLRQRLSTKEAAVQGKSQHHAKTYSWRRQAINGKTTVMATRVVIKRTVVSWVDEDPRRLCIPLEGGQMATLLSMFSNVTQLETSTHQNSIHPRHPSTFWDAERTQGSREIVKSPVAGFVLTRTLRRTPAVRRSYIMKF